LHSSPEDAIDDRIMGWSLITLAFVLAAIVAGAVVIFWLYQFVS
jgi:hypothetical protein